MWYQLTSGVLLNLSLILTLPSSQEIGAESNTITLSTTIGSIKVKKIDAYGIRQAIMASRHFLK